MPVPKSKEKIYGRIVGHLQNLGYSLKEAKTRTDKAIADHPDIGRKKSSKSKRSAGRRAAEMMVKKIIAKKKDTLKYKKK